MPAKQEQEDASAEVTEVAPGVLRFQLPIAFQGLGHVNAYAMEDSRGVAIVDPGLPGAASWRALEHRLAGAGMPLARVHTVVVTHSHPDHYGGAAQLAKESGAEVVAHADFQAWWERPHSHGEVDGDEDASPSRPWELPTPWGGQAYRPPLRRRLAARLPGNMGRAGWTPPEPSRRVEGGDVLDLGRRAWVVVHTPGHTLDHLCLHDPAGGVLLSGDHVLPTITPHISGLGTGADPLAAYLDSLDQVAALDDVSVVLPAHGQPFPDLPGRVAAIRAHHDERLATLRDASKTIGWASVADLSKQLFRQRSWGPMAESETYAHLEHLRLAGQAERRGEEGTALEYLAHG